ncbi:MAG: methyl-accepting chemotaxis protein [Lachnospiraceae bacterium]|nr:methyl-accepting chemotaxis protein [Lachnospiraceae bacterium]
MAEAKTTQNTNGKERKGKLVLHVILVAVAACALVAAILTTISAIQTTSVYHNLIEETLNTAAIQMADEIERMYEGSWNLDEDDNLWKGEHQFKGEFIGALKTQTGLDYAIFYDNIRAITTVSGSPVGRKNADTTAPSDIYSTVVNGGKTYYRPNYVVAGEKYSGVYAPVKDADGSIGGMTCAFRKTSDINSDIRRNIFIMIGAAVICVIIFAAIGIFLYKSSATAMNSIVEAIVSMAKGDLRVEFSEDALKRKDELGTIAESAQTLNSELKEVITSAKDLSHKVTTAGDELSDSSTQASDASNQVTDAIDEISKGAVSQAESVQNSAAETNEIGMDIENITGSVNDMTDYAKRMREACNRAMDALSALLKQNESTVESMKVIDHQIRSTNDAVMKISEASNLITNISEQTNLLALNASIEAARAGDAGKGFAVVATEIGSLANQSQEATVEITQIVDELISESEKSVTTVEELNKAFGEQNKSLDATRNDMDAMTEGVHSVTDSAHDISQEVNKLNNSKNTLLSIIEDLSAISEENAASAEETNASMEELNATFEVISHSADELQELAKKMNDEMSFFTV